MTSRSDAGAAPARERGGAANFDLMARPYRWMEYLSFGPALWRCRTRFLARLTGCRDALILGDGDGRFTAALLASHPQVKADAVDSSRAMLGLLGERARATIRDSSARLRIHHCDVLAFARALPAEARYDLVITHFFLDCLTQAEVESLAQLLAPHLKPGALWVVSEFRIPAGAMRRPASALVRSLYFAFQFLTGLRTSRLPEHSTALAAAGLTRVAQHLRLAGILTSELWACDRPAGCLTSSVRSTYTPDHAVAAATRARRD